MRGKQGLWGWAIYDFANTIFSAVVLTFYFPLYLTRLTGKNLPLGVSTTLAMVLAGLVVPWLGALSDRTGKTKAYLVTTTLLCIAFTLGLSLATNTLVLMATFLGACFFYHASLVFYFVLLPVIAQPHRQGFASGLGTGLGYLGVLFAMPLAYLTDFFWGDRYVFLVAGFLFLIFSIPLFFWVPERMVSHPVTPTLSLALGEWKKVLATVKQLIQSERQIFLFFLGNFFLLEAVNTVIFWLVVYVSRVFGPPEIQVVGIFLCLNFSAFLLGLLAGIVTDRWGAHRTLLLAAASLFVTLLVLGITPHFFTFVAFSLSGGAFGLAGIWTAGRKRLVELAPPEAVGEYFGLYNLTTKVSIVSSLIFSILADRFGFQAALLSQLIPCGLGFLLLWRARTAR